MGRTPRLIEDTEIDHHQAIATHDRDHDLMPRYLIHLPGRTMRTIRQGFGTTHTFGMEPPETATLSTPRACTASRAIALIRLISSEARASGVEPTSNVVGMVETGAWCADKLICSSTRSTSTKSALNRSIIGTVGFRIGMARVFGGPGAAGGSTSRGPLVPCCGATSRLGTTRSLRKHKRIYVPKVGAFFLSPDSLS